MTILTTAVILFLQSLNVQCCNAEPLIQLDPTTNAPYNAAIAPSLAQRHAATSKNPTTCTLPSDVISHNLIHHAVGMRCWGLRPRRSPKTTNLSVVRVEVGMQLQWVLGGLPYTEGTVSVQGLVLVVLHAAVSMELNGQVSCSHVGMKRTRAMQCQ